MTALEIAKQAILARRLKRIAEEMREMLCDVQLDDDFEMNINVGKSVEGGDVSGITIWKSPTRFPDEWQATWYEAYKFGNEDWRVTNAPFIDMAGGQDDSGGENAGEDGQSGSGEAGEKELPPDGLWLCDYRPLCDVDCGRSVR